MGLRCLMLGFSILVAVMPGWGQALIRVAREGSGDVARLISAGIDVVGVSTTCVWVWGPEARLAPKLAELDVAFTTVDPDTQGSQYSLVGLRPGWSDADVTACGKLMWAEDGWALLRHDGSGSEACTTNPHLIWAPMPLVPFEMPKPPPPQYAAFMDGQSQPTAIKPLVEELVAALTSQVALDHWTGVINMASTRYSTSAGCQTAAESVTDWFASWGLQPETQSHTSGHAPNVIGTLPGKIHPDQVYIVIGHLDDLPSSGLAPGADDNASGSATVTALAELMSGYGFACTVKFLAVTGEEFGLYGSTAYAEDALSRGENIQAVLNADMTGWEGDGLPSPENLDLNYNDTSVWLGTLFAQMAVDYQTGCAVDAFSCPGLTASDHAPFWSRGWSAVCGITDNEGYCDHGGHYPYYHTSNDTLANCGDTDFFIGAAKTYLATLAHLADPICRNPSPPANLAAAPDGDNRVHLEWDDAGAGNTYVIYRAPGGCGAWEDAYEIGDTDQTQWLDDQASGQLTYGYFVFSRDATGYCLSPTAACAEAMTTGACLEPPDFAADVGAVNLQETSCGIELSWAPSVPRCGTAVAYNVYRGEVPDFIPDETHLLASCLAECAYVDRQIDSATPYFYVVRAEDDSGNGQGPCAGGNETFNASPVRGLATGPDMPVFEDDLESGGSAWTVQALPGDSGTTPWSVVDSGSHSPTHAWFCSDEEAVKDQVIVMNAACGIPAGLSARLTFWHRVDTEYRWDGGVLEYSVDGGTTWFDILAGNGATVPANANRFTAGGYITTLRSSSNPLSNRPAWSGDNDVLEEVVVDLTDLAGHSVLFRWRMGCDGTIDAPGWWVDDIVVTYPTACQSGPCVLPAEYARWHLDYSILDFVACW